MAYGNGRLILFLAINNFLFFKLFRSLSMLSEVQDQMFECHVNGLSQGTL